MPHIYSYTLIETIWVGCIHLSLCVGVKKHVIETESERKRESHTYPINIVWLSEVAINPVENVECLSRRMPDKHCIKQADIE